MKSLPLIQPTKHSQPTRANLSSAESQVSAIAEQANLNLSACPCEGACPRCQPARKPISAGHDTDVYEQEADQLADQMLRDPAGSSRVVSVRHYSERNSTNQSLLNTSPGQPLRQDLKEFFEPKLGQGLGQVQIHSDAIAAHAAQALRARAFTQGSDIHFNRGQFAPDTPQGKRLLAHELVHVQQQQGTQHAVQCNREPGEVVTIPSSVPPDPTTLPATGRPNPDNRTRHEIAVVDWGENADGFNFGSRLYRIGEEEAATVDEMIDIVRNQTGSVTDNCISKLTLVGHGSPGNISMGAGTGWSEGRSITTGALPPRLNELTPYFCNEALVIIYGCRVARGARGTRFMQELADLWQVNVAGATGTVNQAGENGVWMWGVPGQVLPANTEIIVNQIQRIYAESPSGDDEEMIFEILEDFEATALLRDIQTRLTTLGVWRGLVRNLIEEDAERFYNLYPDYRPAPGMTWEQALRQMDTPQFWYNAFGVPMYFP